MVVMDTHSEDDDLTDDIEEATYRERATAMLNQIAHDAKIALAERDITLDVFFTVPRSGCAVVTFGTLANPSDDQWDQVSEVVSAIVRRSIGLERSRCRALVCATTHTAMLSE
jgi:hypothetical protein